MDATSVQAAADRTAGRVHRTPLLGSATLERLTGRRVVLKNEAVQKTGSFKVRGALNRLLTLPREELARGLVATSAGNHASALAWAAAEVDAKATVVMPLAANPIKVAACHDYGAEVVLHGENTAEAFAEAERLQGERGLTFVHPFDDLEVAAGQGTVGLELVADAGAPDVLVVPVGGGGLMCGVATAVKDANPSCRVVGVEPEGAAALTAALQAGRPVPVPASSVADGLCAPYAGPVTFPLLKELVDEVVTLSERELLDGVRFVMERMKVVVEPAGSAGVAALLAGKPPLAQVPRGATVAVVLSGGNADLAALVPQVYAPRA